MLTIILAVILGVGFGRGSDMGPAIGLSAFFGFVACGALGVLVAQIINGGAVGFDVVLLQSRPSLATGLIVAPFAAFLTVMWHRNAEKRRNG